jgi:hypothetical protein
MFTRKAFLILLIHVFTTAVACSDHEPGNFEGGDPNSHPLEQPIMAFSVAEKPVPPSPYAPVPDAIQRKLLKQGTMRFEADDLRETHAFITALCREYNAYISGESQNDYGSRLQQDLTVRIPADQFDAYIGKLEGHAVKVEQKSIEVSDVTEEFIDTEARLKTKKDLEQRYRDLLRQAKTVSEVISVEAQLVNVRADIESMEGRLKYLNDRVSLSTLNITFYEVIGTDFGFGSKSVAALRQGWDNLLAFLIGVLYLWPFILLIAVVVYWLSRWRKRRRIMAGVPDPGTGSNG